MFSPGTRRFFLCSLVLRLGQDGTAAEHGAAELPIPTDRAPGLFYMHGLAWIQILIRDAAKYLFLVENVMSGKQFDLNNLYLLFSCGVES